MPPTPIIGLSSWRTAVPARGRRTTTGPLRTSSPGWPTSPPPTTSWRASGKNPSTGRPHQEEASEEGLIKEVIDGEPESEPEQDGRPFHGLLPGRRSQSDGPGKEHPGQRQEGVGCGPGRQ